MRRSHLFMADGRKEDGHMRTYQDIADTHERNPRFMVQSSVLVWTANYETTVFQLDEQIHPATVYIWFQTFPRDPRWNPEEEPHTIEKWKLTGSDWELVETATGKIPFVSENPFDPRKQLAASNTAVSVFPENSPDPRRKPWTDLFLCPRMQDIVVFDQAVLEIYNLCVHRWLGPDAPREVSIADMHNRIQEFIGICAKESAEHYYKLTIQPFENEEG